jgi:hypothetical protein
MGKEIQLIQHYHGFLTQNVTIERVQATGDCVRHSFRMSIYCNSETRGQIPIKFGVSDVHQKSWCTVAVLLYQAHTTPTVHELKTELYRFLKNKPSYNKSACNDILSLLTFVHTRSSIIQRAHGTCLNGTTRNVGLKQGHALSTVLFSQFITSQHKHHKLQHRTELNASNNQLTPWSRIFLEKLTVTQLVKELEDSLPCPQEPATSPYPEPDESIPHFL